MSITLNWVKALHIVDSVAFPLSIILPGKKTQTFTSSGARGDHSGQNLCYHACPDSDINFTSPE